jgi:hypothetical protein
MKSSKNSQYDGSSSIGAMTPLADLAKNVNFQEVMKQAMSDGKPMSSTKLPDLTSTNTGLKKGGKSFKTDSMTGNVIRGLDLSHTGLGSQKIRPDSGLNFKTSKKRAQSGYIITRNKVNSNQKIQEEPEDITFRPQNLQELQSGASSKNSKKSKRPKTSTGIMKRKRA